ncbi:MAG: DUF4838 domain-containing protein [Phycisphaeraceae bacterium]
MQTTRRFSPGFWLLLALLCGGASPAAARAAEPMVLAEQGRSVYRIVVPREPAPAVRHAADELQRHVERIAGVELRIVGEDEPGTAHELFVGPVERAMALISDADRASLGDEDYLLRRVGERLVIVGGSPRGTLYGTYGLLQDYLGCRWFTAEVSHLPRRPRLVLDEVDDVGRPAFGYRWTLIHEAYDADWAARNRLNGFNGLENRHGGGVRFVPGHESHTFYRLLPPGRHFDQHPEFYSLVEGERLRDGGQLCATNEQVVARVTARVRELLAEHPDRPVISLSQNDNNNYCRCDRCAALDEREGTHAAQVLHLVNAVAEAIEADLPDRSIETLAYEWSRRPPRTMRARANVIVRYSTIRGDFASPLEGWRGNGVIVRDLTGWRERSEQVWVWNYTTYFSYYLLPWPNYAVMDANLRYLAEQGAAGVFEQGNWQAAHGELQALRAYVLARLLWNPRLDGAALIDEFLAGVYGKAAPHLRAYLDLLSDAVQRQDKALRIYGSRTPDYLNDEVLDEADRSWDLAEQAVADAPDVSRRVREARLSLDYAIIERHRARPSERLTYDGPPRRGRVASIDDALVRRIERFLATAEAAGLTHVREGDGDYASYARELASLLPDR